MLARREKTEKGRNLIYSLRREEVGLVFRESAMVAAKPSDSFQRMTIFSATFIAVVERV